MTTIAWDGKTLAADKLCNYGGTKTTVTKIVRLSDGSLAGGAGQLAFIKSVLQWLDRGADPASFPEHQKDKDDWQTVLHITTNGAIHLYERAPFPIVYEDRFKAIGSGREYAMAAMHLGKSAIEAIAVASVFDVDTGNGVDVLELVKCSSGRA